MIDIRGEWMERRKDTKKAGRRDGGRGNNGRWLMWGSNSPVR
jgi:hypothetical protein